MNEVRVIGIGSPFHNDDIGWRVVDWLRKNQDLPETIELIEMDRPGINLLHLLQGAQQVILVDTVLDVRRHGEILLLDRDQLAASSKHFSSHGLDVANALQLAEQLDTLPAQLSILAMAVDPACEHAIDDRAIQQLGNLISDSLARLQRTASAG